jgi:hypothetical protein
MAQFARGDQDSIEQLLDLGVTGLRFVEYLADEIYWLLDLVHVPDLLALDDDGSTDYPVWWPQCIATKSRLPWAPSGPEGM